jgi:SAM-dependent methyltransferase
MTQNIYDNQEFFQNYSQLPRSVEGLDGAPEWPALQALLPEIAGRHVLDLGCGFGWFCRWAAGQGATRVLGVDVSERMLARARAETDSAIVSYTRADLEHFAPPSGTFHLAYSSLAFHYIENMADLVAKVHAALAPGGKLVFSAEHPIMTAPANQGWLSDASGQVSWPVNGYLDEGPRITNWLAKGVVKQHRTIGTYVDLLVGAGFAVSRICEWGPSEKQVAEHPEWANERQRPPFLLVACDRP